MEDKDQLKDILSNINHINEPIDLEASIMQSIQKEALVKQKIASYKKQGIRGLVISIILVITLVFIYSFSDGLQTTEGSHLKYTSIVACLILLFAQLEIGGLKFINQIKNN
ncbi:hypothetical protein [Winogradskyella sp. R77965]|uniref:hypothetical protein n=1 Tax=Winogradskyella sp. R77965 TaxID=3093872 RepID=UPI0037DC0CA8